MGVATVQAAQELPLAQRPLAQEMIREKGWVSIPSPHVRKALDLIPDGGFLEGRHYTFRLRFEQARFAFVTGRDYEYVFTRGGKEFTNELAEAMTFVPVAERDSGLWYAVDVFEDSPAIVDRRYRRSRLTLNYIMPEQNFSTIDNVARWQEREAATLRRDLLREDLLLGVEVSRDKLRFFVNGVFMRDLAREGIDLGNCVLRIQDRASISDTVRCDALTPHYRMLDIRERLNASGIPGAGSLADLPKGETVEVAGVPFLLPDDPKYDHVDLYQSWMEAAMRCGYGITEVWTRWRAATDKVPLRYQFRVPFENYEALYVLAASDGRTDTIPRFTAQFYLPRRGRPVNFASADIPAFDAEGEVRDALPVTLSNGKKVRLYLVKVKLEPGQFVKFSRGSYFDMELTKDVQTYRAYPDPLTHSIHGAGLPSSVRVFGITFGRSKLPTRFTPENFANIWHDGERVTYQVDLENITDAKTRAQFSRGGFNDDRDFTRQLNESHELLLPRYFGRTRRPEENRQPPRPA